LRHPGRTLLALALLGLIGLGAYFGVRYFRAEYHYRAAQSALERHDYSRAMDHLREYLAVWPDNPDARLLLARTARRAEDFAEAERQLERYEQGQGIPEAADLERQLQQAQRGDLKREELLQYYVRHDHPDRLLILEALAQGYIRTHRLPRAYECLKQWLECRPTDAKALFWRGLVWDMFRNYPEAITDYRRALEQDPTNDKARLYLADLLVQQSQAKEALGHYQKVLKKDPENRQKLLGLAWCRLTLGHTTEARKILDSLLQDPRPSPRELFLRGKLELDLLRPDKAEPWLRKAIALQPYDRQTVYQLAQCLKLLHKEKESEDWFARLDRLDVSLRRLKELNGQLVVRPQDPDLQCEVGKIHLSIGNDPEGLRWLYSALAEDRRHRPTHQALAEYYRKIGKPELAKPHLPYLEK
jgi:tetratricopeptide (TPR) repeat protein